MLTRVPNARFFRVLIWSGLVSFSIWKLLSTPALLANMPVDDFVQYWSAGRLQLQGRNPYSPELLLQVQRAAGRTGDRPLMMWNPPWTLFFVMPFAAVSHPVARLLWLLLALSQRLVVPIFCGDTTTVRSRIDG